VIKRYHVPSTPCKKTERDRVLIDEKTNRNSLVRSGSATRAYRLALGIGTETWEKGGLGPVRSFWAVPVGCGRRLRENLPRLCSRHRMIGVKPASGRLYASSGAGICGAWPSCGNSIRVALYSETSQNGAEMSSKKLPVSLFAATQVATHPSISSSDDQDMRGRVRCGLPNAC
jgi:hypothetical protein